MNRLHPVDMLRVHPLRQSLPYLAVNPTISSSVVEIGVLEPLICTEMESANGGAPGFLYVVNGVDRLNGAIAAMIHEVPVTIIPQAMVLATILHTLLARKHLTKSALAFIAFPLLENAMEESRLRMIAHQSKAGNKVGDKGVVSNDSLTTRAKTVEELTQMLGMGRDMLFKSRNVHGFLKKVSNAKREEITGRILSGDLDLTGAIHALSGHESTAGKNRSTPGQLELFDRDLTSLAARWQKWKTLPEPARNQVAQKFAAQVEEWPEEVIKAVVARLEKGVQ